MNINTVRIIDDIRDLSPVIVKMDLSTDLPTSINSVTWESAKEDLYLSLANVPNSELQVLIDALNNGTVNGRAGYMVEGCGCFVAILASRLLKRTKEINTGESFETFRLAYGHIYLMSPFQEWLCVVEVGDTPKTNRVAKLFADELTLMIEANTVQ